MKAGDSVKGYTLFERLDLGGSDREFFRCTKDNRTFIMVHDQDLNYYVALQKHLRKKGIPVPALHWYDAEEKLILQEDLGDTSLFILNKSAKRQELTRIYQQAIDVLAKLQIEGRQDAPVQVFYDRVHIQWEQEYFRNCFLIQYCGIQRSALTEIDIDFRNIADQVLDSMKGMSDFLMHRDFQSQNIYLKDGKVHIIDFQSARIGPLTYDLAALLRDAYVHITPEQEEELLKYYANNILEHDLRINEEEIQQSYELTCLQRNMQALGAFANLSMNKGKEHFRQYIPRGLQLLRHGLRGKSFMKLEKIVAELQV